MSNLASIIIITYNSSKYLIETLESAKNQSYYNIELIISDDCSTDNTVEVAKNWLAINSTRFIDAKIVNTKTNSGIAINCNNGVQNSNGIYVKIIAGDDILAPNCVEDNIAFFLSNKEIKIAASKTKVFFKNDLNNFFIWPNKGEFPLGFKKQQLEILKANFVYNVSIFFKRELFDLVGGFDANYPMIEDYPFDYKVLMSGYEFYLLDKVTVYYRVNYDSTSRPENQGAFVNLRSFNDGYNFINNILLKELLKNRSYLWYLLRKSKLELIKRIIKNGNSADKRKNYMVHKLLFLNKWISAHLRRLENRFARL